MSGGFEDHTAVIWYIAVGTLVGVVCTRRVALEVFLEDFMEQQELAQAIGQLFGKVALG